jgi:hypothetical protein
LIDAVGYSRDIPGLGFHGITLGFEKTKGFPKTRGIPKICFEHPGFKIYAGFRYFKGI